MSDFYDYEDDSDTDQDAWIAPLLYLIGGLAIAYLIVSNSGPAVTETIVQTVAPPVTPPVTTSSTEGTTE
jgi:hypothetical protein